MRFARQGVCLGLRRRAQQPVTLDPAADFDLASEPRPEVRALHHAAAATAFHGRGLVALPTQVHRSHATGAESTGQPPRPKGLRVTWCQWYRRSTSRSHGGDGTRTTGRLPTGHQRTLKGPGWMPRQDRDVGLYAGSVFDEEAFWEQLDDWVLVQVAESRRHEPTMDWDEFLESIGENDDDD